MSRLIQTCSLVFALSLPSMVWAHPGHGEAGPAHYVTEPVHAIPFLVALAVITAAIIFGRRWLSGSGLSAAANPRRTDRK